MKITSDRCSIRVFWTTCVLAALLWVPVAAEATPMNYAINQGVVKFDVKHGRRSVRISLRIDGGSFTYDNATGIVSNMSLTRGNRTFDLSQAAPSASSAKLKLRRNGRVVLRAAGLPIPRGGLIGNRAGTATVRLTANFFPSPVPVIPGVPGTPASAVPEPAAALVFGLGLVISGHAIRRSSLR